MFSMFSSPRAHTRLDYSNPEVDAPIAAAQTERDQQKRVALYKEAQEMVLQDAALVILGYADRVMGAKKEVSNLMISPVGSLPLGNVTFGE